MVWLGSLLINSFLKSLTKPCKHGFSLHFTPEKYQTKLREIYKTPLRDDAMPLRWICKDCDCDRKSIESNDAAEQATHAKIADSGCDSPGILCSFRFFLRIQPNRWPTVNLTDCPVCIRRCCLDECYVRVKKGLSPPNCNLVSNRANKEVLSGVSLGRWFVTYDLYV